MDTPADASIRPDFISVGRRIGALAGRHPEAPAVILVDRAGQHEVLTWHRLEEGSNAAARVLAGRGVSSDSVVAIALPAGFDHVLATVAVWKLGGLVLPLDAAAPDRELRVILETARPDLVITGRDLSGAGRPEPAVLAPDALLGNGTGALPEPAGEPRSAHATGGSTGQPRIIVRRPSWIYPAIGLPSPGDRAIGLDIGQVQLILLPLYSAGFTKLYHGLALDHTVILMPDFAPKRIAEVIDRYRVNYFQIVPNLMRRLLNSPDFLAADLSSITTVHQSSAGSPRELKQAWLRRFPPETLYEGYSSQERIGAVWIRGDEWLEHPGSVGRPTDCEIRIYTAEGGLAEPGEVGEVFMRSAVTAQPTYLGGGPPLAQRDGFLSLGDAGFLDSDGYLHIAGRTVEMINVGGVKVYPAEVEEVLLTHPGVRDAAVVGRAHDYLGQAPHAVIVPRDPEHPPSSAELHRHCRLELSLAKVPQSYEVRAEIPRNAAGKLRRTSLLPGSDSAAVDLHI